MADFTALKTAIQTYIKQNGNEEITGEILQEILLSVVTTLGDSAINDLVTALANEVAARQNADGTLQQNITNEATARGNADTALGGRIDDEATARANGDTALSNRLGSTITAENTAADQIGAEAEARAAADTALQNLIDGITDNIENGYVYAGIATPSSTPATGKVFYLALTAGTYTNFGNIEVSQGINILKYNGSVWSLDAFIGIDDELTPSSNNLPKSGNVLENIIKNGSAFDLSAYNAEGGVLATYADLDAALTALNALPAVYKQGGMSFRFVDTYDNKYVQYFLTKNTWSASDGDWEKMNLEEEVEQVRQKVDDLIQDADTEDDFDISDDDGNIIVRFDKGNIRTKEFDSMKTPTIGNNDFVDLSIEDEDGNCIVLFEDGEVKTKGFDSSTLKTEDDTDEDFSIQDKEGNIIIGIKDGFPITKNFIGKEINERISALENGGGELEEWSKMPALGDNPLSFVRFDGGMGRIFRTWGFIGDSLNSGEMYGKITDILSLAVDYDGYEISGGALSPQSGSVVTEEYAISAYKPKLRLVFQSNSGLSGKVLVASVSGDVYSTILTGDTATTYTITLTGGQSIVISYPSNNTPQILFGSTYVSDMYDLSWGQQMVRMLGSSGYNFSVGGEYCKRWCIGTDNNRRWQKAQTELKDVYTIALGVNDRSYWLANETAIVDYPCVSAYPNQSQYGSLTITKAQVLTDIDLDDYGNNANSYAGWYAGIIQRLKSVRPDAHIFCITYPGEGGGKEWNQTIRLVVEIMQGKYGNTIWLLDLETYNPNTPEITANCNLNGHWSAFGYLYAAYEISTYIDWLIRKNINAFRGTSLIGTGSSVEEWTII